MTTPGTLLDRSVDWLLDHDGDIYGDEQERLRWYEGIAAAASVQWILVPWVVAVWLLAAGRAVAPALLCVIVALYLPMLAVNGYVGRRKVRTIPDRWSRKRIAVTVAAALPYLVMTFGFFRAFDPQVTEVSVGGLVGGCVGVAVAVVALRVSRRRQLARERDERDRDEVGAP